MLPNQANVIPNEVKFIIEIRSDKVNKLNKLEKNLYQIFHNTYYTEINKITEKEPSKMDDTIQYQFEQTLKKLGYSYTFLMSGANHDANSLAKK